MATGRAVVRPAAGRLGRVERHRSSRPSQPRCHRPGRWWTWSRPSCSSASGISMVVAPLDQHADGFGPRAVHGRRVGDQQRDLAGSASRSSGRSSSSRSAPRSTARSASLAPGLDTASAEVRRAFPPLNPPAAGATEAQIAAARQASIDAFHQAMVVSAGLLVIAAGISFVGLRGRALPAERGGPGSGPGPARPRPSPRPAPDPADGARLGRHDLRPGGRPDDALGHGRPRSAAAARRRARARRRLRQRPRHRAAGRAAPERTRDRARRLAVDGRGGPGAARPVRGAGRRSLVADLGQPLPIEAGSVDAVLSTATFHWVPDHDALFANLARRAAAGRSTRGAVRRRRQHRDVQRALADIGDGWLGPAHFETAWPRRTPECGRLRRHRVLADRRTDPLRARRAVRDLPADGGPGRPPGAPAGGAARGVRAGRRDRLGEPVIDYVRLNIDARRAD